MNLSGLVGYTGGHVLGNFSVTKQRGEAGGGFTAKLKDLQDGIAAYQVVVESGGKVIPGGRQQFIFAAKGLWDDERTPGRTWVVTGMGANAESCESGSSTGGRGKTMKFFLKSPLGCLGRFLRSKSHEIDGFLVLDLVLFDARRRREQKSLPRSLARTGVS